MQGKIAPTALSFRGFARSRAEFLWGRAPGGPRPILPGLYLTSLPPTVDQDSVYKFISLTLQQHGGRIGVMETMDNLFSVTPWGVAAARSRKHSKSY